MALPDRDVERLDHALDAQLAGREENDSGPPSDLITTFSRLRSMNDQVPTDPALKNELWRSMMSALPITRTQSQRIPLGTPHSRTVRMTFVGAEKRHGRKGVLFEGVIAILLIIGTVAGAIGYRQINDENTDRTILAPAATEVPSDAPVASDCQSTARPDGRVEELAGTQPTIPPALPRNGNDPVFDETAGNGISDGSELLLNSVGVDGSVDGVSELLQQLVACRFFNGPSAGARDLDGKYFALYSDDFFRRELAGYKEAGKEINLVSLWMPSTIPTVLETRIYGSRLFLVLEKSNDRMTSFPVLMLAWNGLSWQVDEVGTASMPDNWVAANPSSPPTVGEVMGTPRLDIALYDTNSPIKDANGEYSCPAYEANGAPVPCGQPYALLGPYLYSAYPENTDFTISFSNIGTDTRHIVADGLGIDVRIAPGASATFVINVAAGNYPFAIYIGGNTDPDSEGTFTFAPPDQQRAVG
ncbi:hypothetical protein BH09CHL1_BH09CHL1_08120 [soil metagenome]